MPLPEGRQVSNLIFFLRDRPQFIGRDVTAGDMRAPLSEDYVGCAMLESFFWLDLGVQINYFPRAEARRVAYEYFPQFLKAYEHVQQKRLIQKFTPPLQRMLGSEFSGRTELFSHREGLDYIRDEALAPFQATLILANGFAGDLDTEQITDSLVFKNMLDWSHVMREFKEVNDTAEPQSERFIQVREAVSSTVLKIVQYMECYREILLDFDKITDGPEKIRASSIVNLKQRVKDIQNWRLDFKEHHVFERFLELLNLALALWGRDAKDGRIEFQRRITPAMVQAIRILMIDWGGPPLSFEVGAS